MTFFEKIKTGIFWKKTLQIALAFFVILFVVSLLFKSFSALISFDWQAVAEQNFTEGKWQRFFGAKIAISLVYGIWVTSKHIK